jgi:serine/threonine protein kinase
VSFHTENFKGVENNYKALYPIGIIHSDLKPANFLLVGGRMKLIDFGIASSVQSDMTSVFKDAQAGTFNYMSPESIQATHSTNGNQSGFKVTTCLAHYLFIDLFTEICSVLIPRYASQENPYIWFKFY